MGFLDGKRAVITGVASNRSIAWGIARAMRQQGAELAFTYQNERLGERVKKLAAEVDSDLCIECDVGEDRAIVSAFDALGARWSEIDICVHAIAFAPREELQGNYLDSATRDGFRLAHDVSAYSFTALAQAARGLMQERSGALLTLTYLGAERVVPNYNVMGLAKASLEASVRYIASSVGPEGIRANAISAGPIKTLAAAGISDFRRFLEHVQQSAPLRRNVSIEDVGNVAAFLCSDLAAGITGEVIHVDSGYSTVAMAGLTGTP